MSYVAGHRDEQGVWHQGYFTCDRPCPTHHMCQVVSHPIRPPHADGYCHWTDHAPGWRDLSRTGKLIWLHAAKKEGFNVRDRIRTGSVVVVETET